MINTNKIFEMLSEAPSDFVFTGLSVDNDNKMVLHFDYSEKSFDQMIYNENMEELQRLLNDLEGE